MIIYRTFRIHASRFLPNLEDNHICKRMHGHTFNITVYVNGEIDKKTGFVMDFFELDLFVKKEVIDKIDHKVLNEIKNLENPSSEHLAIFVWDRLVDKVAYLSKIIISEDHGTGIEYSG